MTRLSLAEKLLRSRESGLSEKQIAEMHELSTTDVRAMMSIGRGARRIALKAGAMKFDGYKNKEIADALGLTESELRLVIEASKD